MPPTITENESNLTSRAAGVDASTPVVARPFDTRRCSSVSASFASTSPASSSTTPAPSTAPPSAPPSFALAPAPFAGFFFASPSPLAARRAAFASSALAFFAALSSALLGPPLKSTISSFFFAVPVTASICDMVARG